MSNLSPAHTSVDAKQAKSMLDNGAFLIDVREPAEFNNTHINGAKLHSLGSISADAVAHIEEQTAIIYCQKGARGKKACDKILAELPNANIVNLEGGIEAWQAANFDTTKGSSNVLPLDRQVQITIGSCVLGFSLLAHFFNTNFILGAAFFGAGLCFAGITGFCGLARVMAIAPWNK